MNLFPVALRGDCLRCMGLCCVALPFDRSPMFALHKRADVRCPHLRDDHRCGIHGDLVGAGFAGCAAYDCHGAGQRVTAAVALHSEADPERLDAAHLHRIFRSLCHLHEMAILLRAAAGLDLPPPLEAERVELLHRVERGPGATLPELDEFDADAALTVAGAFLRRLRPVVTASRRLPLLRGAGDGSVS